MHFLFEIPAPPYFLVGIAALGGFACGKAFEVSIRRKTQEWSEGLSDKPLRNIYEPRLFVPYLGICLCSWIFVGSALTTFAVTWAVGFAMSSFVILSSGLLVWYQLGILLRTLEEGGSEALEIK